GHPVHSANGTIAVTFFRTSKIDAASVFRMAFFSWRPPWHLVYWLVIRILPPGVSHGISARALPGQQSGQVVRLVDLVHSNSSFDAAVGLFVVPGVSFKRLPFVRGVLAGNAAGVGSGVRRRRHGQMPQSLAGGA